MACHQIGLFFFFSFLIRRAFFFFFLNNPQASIWLPLFWESFPVPFQLKTSTPYSVSPKLLSVPSFHPHLCFNPFLFPPYSGRQPHPHVHRLCAPQKHVSSSLFIHRLCAISPKIVSEQYISFWWVFSTYKKKNVLVSSGCHKKIP